MWFITIMENFFSEGKGTVMELRVILLFLKLNKKNGKCEYTSIAGQQVICFKKIDDVDQ
jgi:hypothetical protein